jgi:hypothetical protein
MTRPLVQALCLLAFAACALTACSRPEKPETERPPAPQAVANLPDKDTWKDASKREAPATDLLDYTQAPQKRAKATEKVVLDQGAQQRADIDAQAAGNASPPPSDQ